MPPSDVECTHPVRHMGQHGDHRKSSRNPQTPRAVREGIPSARVDQSIRMHDHLKSEKSTGKSYGHLHREVKVNLVDDLVLPRKSLGNHQKPYPPSKTKDDELVKHMSNLPRYLQRVERGENLQEKVLNFGVLDWGRLESWKYNQRPVEPKPVAYSPSTSNTSSPFSSFGSSTLSTRSDSGSLANKKQSPPRGGHLISSSKDYHSVSVKPTRTKVATPQDKLPVCKNASVGRQKSHALAVSSQKREKSEKGKIDVSSEVTREMGTTPSDSKGCELSFITKGESKVSGGDCAQKAERVQEPTPDGQQCSGRDKTIVLLLPKKGFPGPPVNAELTVLNDNKIVEAARRSFSDSLCLDDEVPFSKVYSGIPHSCPQLSRTEPGKPFNINLPRSIESVGSRAPSSGSHPIQHSEEKHNVRSDHVQAEENNLTTKPIDITGVEYIKRPSPKTEEPPSARRSYSPNRWLSAGRGKVSRSLSFKEDSTLPQLSSTYVTAKSGPVESDVCSESAVRDKVTANTRSRSSPLRRLLDPLLRTKTANRTTCMEPMPDEGHTACKSSDRLFPPSVQTVRGNANSSGSAMADANGVPHDETNGVSMVQALLQVTVKNGLPWFTFAVDNNSDILAATMKKTSSSEKYDCSWVYTFYSFHKTKKKSGGWMGQGSKSRNPDYVPNIVGQMKVNGSCCTKSSRSDSEGQLSVREFVLLDLQPRKADQETSNLVSKVELAAIVIKVPSEATGSLTSAGQQSYSKEDTSDFRQRECGQSEKCCHSILEIPNSGPNAGSQNLSSIVVVLPSGVHGLPANGNPSPLLDRWKSGGSCDCGGWDLGCELKLFSNHDDQSKDQDYSESFCTQDKFDLFSQGGESQKGVPSLSFATHNKGVYSFDFNASISSLQAFSICIAFLHCKNLARVSNLFQEMIAQEPMPIDLETIKSYQFEGKAPSSCAPFPPPSPVGRV